MQVRLEKASELKKNMNKHIDDTLEKKKSICWIGKPNQRLFPSHLQRNNFRLNYMKIGRRIRGKFWIKK